MSIIHVNQIKNQVLKLFTSLIDISDVATATQEMMDNFILTRSLAAYAIYYLAGATPQDAILLKAVYSRVFVLDIPAGLWHVMLP
ncbi:MAG: hypothetical protein P4L43_07150 [Syntrophobacteraceae bacterium]|nr:hypothetical protein [Syntrophobacteraceae bacterium]